MIVAVELGKALRGEPHVPILVEDPVRAGGNVVDWREIDAMRVLGAILRAGFKVSLAPASPGVRVLHLHRTEGPEL